jgi:hypothetical protein
MVLLETNVGEVCKEMTQHIRMFSRDFNNNKPI